MPLLILFNTGYFCFQFITLCGTRTRFPKLLYTAECGFVIRLSCNLFHRHKLLCFCPIFRAIDAKTTLYQNTLPTVFSCLR